MKEIILTKRNYNWYKSRKMLDCERCSIPFKEGETIVSKISQNLTKRYHKKCYNELFYESEEDKDDY